MSVKSKRREKRRKSLAESGKAAPNAKGAAQQLEDDEPFTLNAILADFRANKELEQAAEGIKPVKDTDFDDLFDIPAPERVTEAAEASAPEKGPETPFDAFTADEATENPSDHAFIPEETTERLFKKFMADEPTETSSDHAFIANETTERLFNKFMAEEVTETPSDTFTAEEVTEKPSDAFTAQEVTETPSDAFTTEEVTETPSDAFTTEEATEKPFDAFIAQEATETPSDTFTADEATETPSEAFTAQEVTETPSATETESLSDTQAFPRVASDASPASTSRRRLFRRAKKRKDVKEDKQDGEPRSISLEEVVGNTVDAVKADAVLDGQSARRSLFSRRRLEDTDEETSGEHTEIIGPEPNLKTAAEQARREYVRRIDGLLPAVIPAVLPLLVLLLETLGLRFPFLTESVVVRPLLLLACLGATLWFCRSVFTDHPCSAAFLCGVSAIAAALDCLTMPFLSGRSMAEPYGAVACLALLSAKVGSSLESHGAYDAFHAAGLDRNPPYLVTDTVNGARKRRGAVTGFYTAALAQNFSNRWQTLLLPVTLAASLVFAALSSVGQERVSDFFLNWSAILTAGATLVLPLCWGLPWARLASRLKNSGCAVAGWRGAEQLARKRKMVVTDSDLFPPGSVRVQDTRLYDDDMPTAVSITASMIRESGCGLARIFDDLLKSEGGDYLPVRDFHFYEDGGFSGTIKEDKILLGTSSFLRKMSVRFPGDFYFPMGLYLSVNGELMATFALRYEALENVDYALRIMRRNRVTAILAARDPNVTPKLLQRVFRRKIDAEYPGLNNRIALSDMGANREIPCGLLFREGLSPYAETVVGSLKLCAGVRRATRLSLFGSGVGAVLAFYLVYQAKYYLFSPLNLLLFLLLWTVPAVLLMDLS